MGFSVDETCIDCDLCRQLAPASFARDDRRGQSFVHDQPRDAAATHRALMSLVACPTASIHSDRKLDSRAAARAFPEHVDGPVFACGWASADSYGAASWLVRRPDGNVLVDSPRRSKILMDRLDELGGVRWMFLSHRDDVADHRAYRERFGCERVIHRADLAAAPDCERVIDDVTALAPDLLVIPTPGHTRGSACLLVGDTYLFTGDHLWADDGGAALDAGRDVCWYSWPEQRASMSRLAAYRFSWVLPGHGRRLHLDTDAMRRAVEDLAARM